MPKLVAAITLPIRSEFPHTVWSRPQQSRQGSGRNSDYSCGSHTWSLVGTVGLQRIRQGVGGVNPSLHLCKPCLVSAKTSAGYDLLKSGVDGTFQAEVMIIYGNEFLICRFRNWFIETRNQSAEKSRPSKANP